MKTTSTGTFFFLLFISVPSLTIICRVGRTGRAGAKGTSYTFISPDEDQFASELIKALDLSRQGNKITAALTELADNYRQRKVNGLRLPFVNRGYRTEGFKFIEGELSKRQQMRAKEKQAYEIEANGGLVEEKSDKAMVLVSPTSSTDVRTLFGLTNSDNRLTPAQLALNRAAQFAAAFNASTPGIHSSDEVEINDFSQAARYKVTSRHHLRAISELTNCAFTVRGTYVPPGRALKMGERKLYLFIEGPSSSEVVMAKEEVRKILVETNSLPTERSSGRYNIN